MNKNTSIIVVAVVVAVLAVGGFVLARSKKTEAPNNTTQTTTQQSGTPSPESTNQNESKPAAETASIDITNFAFAPGSLTVKKGTTVTWTNKDSVGHTVTPDEENIAFSGSQTLQKDHTYKFTFDTPGTYTYHCQPHPQMKGTIIVTE